MNEQEAIEAVGGALTAFRFAQYVEGTMGLTLPTVEGLRFYVADGDWYAEFKFADGHSDVIKFSFIDWVDWCSGRGY